MKFHRLLVILNPKAGRWGSEKMVPAQLKKLSRKHGLFVTFRHIHGSTDARVWAEFAAKEQFDVVAIAGGDGTVNEVIHGLQESGKPLPIALIPTGSANLLAQELGIPKTVTRAIDLILSGNTRAIDLGWDETHHRYLITSAMVGFGSKIFDDANRELKNFLGYPAYILAAIKNLIRVPNAHFLCQYDQRALTFDAQLVIVANAPWASMYPLNLAQAAQVDDGLLDVLSFTNADFVAGMKFMAGTLMKSISLKPPVTSSRVQKIDVQTDPVLPVAIDGELVGQTPLTIRIIPQAQPIIVPSLSRS